MSLRDQLLKSGLASKEQAKKAQREVSKRQHQEVKDRKDQGISTPSPAELVLQAKREADRLLNQRRNEERLLKEKEARSHDIIANHDLRDPSATEPYYFVFQERRIGRILVNEEQGKGLETGELAIVSYDIELGFALVTKENAEKIMGGHPSYIMCLHG